MYKSAANKLGLEELFITISLKIKGKITFVRCFLGLGIGTKFNPLITYDLNDLLDKPMYYIKIAISVEWPIEV